VEKSTKELRKKKGTEDELPEDVLKLLGEDGLKITKKLIKTIYETEDWPKDFTEVTMIALTSYKMQRPSHKQPYRKYSKDSSKDT